MEDLNREDIKDKSKLCYCCRRFPRNPTPEINFQSV